MGKRGGFRADTIHGSPKRADLRDGLTRLPIVGDKGSNRLSVQGLEEPVMAHQPERWRRRRGVFQHRVIGFPLNIVRPYVAEMKEGLDSRIGPGLIVSRVA